MRSQRQRSQRAGRPWADGRGGWSDAQSTWGTWGPQPRPAPLAPGGAGGAVASPGLAFGSLASSHDEDSLVLQPDSSALSDRGPRPPVQRVAAFGWIL